MHRKALPPALLVLVLAASAAAQTTGRLSRLIPELYGPDGLVVDSLAPLPSGQTHSGHFNSAFQTEFNQFNIALASQVASVPIPSSASGFTYNFDTNAGVFVRSTNSFGPIFAERADTIGRHKFSFGFSAQHFTFDTIEGMDLERVPAVFTHDTPAPGGKADVVSTLNRIDARVSQFNSFFTVGLSDRIDLTLVIPVVSADLGIVSDATIRRIGTTDPKIHFFDANGELGTVRRFESEASASGIGDIHLQVKRVMYRAESLAVAAGLDARFPSGDEEDLLGTGAMGLRPFVAVSSSHKILSSHLNLSYQWNGKSVLAGDILDRTKADLPDRVLYVGSVDFAVHPRLTLAAELLGQVLIDSPRLLPADFTALDGQSVFPSIAFTRNSFSETNIATGLKLNVFQRLLMTADCNFAIDSAGLRDKVTPLLGVEYSF